MSDYNYEVFEKYDDLVACSMHALFGGHIFKEIGPKKVN